MKNLSDTLRQCCSVEGGYTGGQGFAFYFLKIEWFTFERWGVIWVFFRFLVISVKIVDRYGVVGFLVIGIVGS